MSARVVSFVNFKGGVGKTALTVNVATSLAHDFGESVLVIDLDPQCNSSIQLLGVRRWDEYANSRPDETVYGLLRGKIGASSAIHRKSVVDDSGSLLVPNLHVIPASYDLMNIEHAQIRDGKDPFHVRFWLKLNTIINHYDYILLDCPPNMYRTTQCGIFASEQLIIPCNLDMLSIIGLSLIARKVKEFRESSHGDHERVRPGFALPRISSIILNNVPTTQTATNRRAKTYLETRIVALRQANMIAPQAGEFVPQVRSAAAFRMGTFDSVPVRFSSSPNAALLEDYRNIARHIKNLK